MSDGKHRRVRADAERERDDGRRGKAWVAAHHAQAVGEVLLEPLERPPPPHLARDLLDLRDVAELEARGARCRFSRLSPLDSIADRHLEVSAHFVLEIGVPVASSPSPDGPPRHDSCLACAPGIENASDGYLQLLPPRALG